MDLEDLTRRLQQDHRMTIVLVTHDIDEAVYLSDRIAVLSKNPARLVEVVDVSLGAERDQIHTREMSTFADLRGRILSTIRDVQTQPV
jgi:NitT/TauT family transport system ATP-binding protein